MGDNRDDSLDSRFPVQERGIGFVPVENLIGRASSSSGRPTAARRLAQALDLVHAPCARDRIGDSFDGQAVNELAELVRETLGHEPERFGLFERALTHGSAAATVTNGWNSSATGCSAWSSRAGSTSGSRTSPRASCRAATTSSSRAKPAQRSAARSAFRRIIRLGKQAREDGASQSDNVVGDVVEALIGALLLDGGLDTAEPSSAGLGAVRGIARTARPSIPSRRSRNSPRPGTGPPAL